MSFIPEFELGLWNAWIFMVPSLLLMLLCLLVMTKKSAPSGPARITCKSKTTLLVASLSKMIYLPAAIYSVFLLFGKRVSFRGYEQEKSTSRIEG